MARDRRSHRGRGIRARARRRRPARLARAEGRLRSGCDPRSSASTSWTAGRCSPMPLSGSGLVLDKLEFRGELRSLLGPVKGEGAFVLNGQHYPFRFAVGRLGDDGAARVRLTSTRSTGRASPKPTLSVTVEAGVPHFEGTMHSRARSGARPQGASELIVEPWRVTEPDQGRQHERNARSDRVPVRTRRSRNQAARRRANDARRQAAARRRAVLGADRPRPHPGAAGGARPSSAAGAQGVRGTRPRARCALPFPVRIGLQVETLTLAGAPLQRFSGLFKSDGETWDIERLEFRAPGVTQVRLGGRVGLTPTGAVFKGPLEVDANDPRALLAWLTGSCRCAVGDLGPAARRRHADARQRRARRRGAQGGTRPHDDCGPPRLSLGRRWPPGAHRLAR